jgi:serine/threonine protein kinase
MVFQKILKQLNHPNIAHFSYDHIVVVIAEYFEGIILKSLIKDTKSKKNFSENLICFIYGQIISVLILCHSHNIYYQDINPENILITNDNQIKFIDFGLSELIGLQSQIEDFIPETIFIHQFLNSSK